MSAILRRTDRMALARMLTFLITFENRFQSLFQ